MSFGDIGFHVVRWGLRPVVVRTVRDAASEPVRVLQSGGVFQSATYLGERCMEPVFEYYRAFGRVLDGLPAARRVLVVGGGACSVPKLIAATRPDLRVDVAEVDPRVVDAARRWFFVDDAAKIMADAGGELRLICDDGFDFIRGAALRGEKYDFIALDAFSGAEPVASLASPEAARAYADLLRGGGAVAANVVTPGGDATFLAEFQMVLETEFPQVELLPCADDEWASDDNYLLVASRG